MIKYPCPCCKILIYESPADGDYSICPICGWEDDPIQKEYPDLSGGANKMSLNEAQKAFEHKKLSVGVKK